MAHLYAKFSRPLNVDLEEISKSYFPERTFSANDHCQKIKGDDPHGRGDTIICLIQKQAGQFTKMYTTLDPVSFWETLERKLPQDIMDRFKEALTGTSLAWHQPTAYELSQRENNREETRLANVSLQAIEGIPSPRNEGTFNSSEVLWADQREAIVSDEAHPIICSHGAGPCVIVAFRNSLSVQDHTKAKGSLGHIDDLTAMDASLDILLGAVRSSSVEPVELHIRSGNASRERILEIMKWVNRQQGINIKTADIFSGHPQDLALDVRDGRTYEKFNHQEMVNNNPNDNLQNKLFDMESMAIALSGQKPVIRMSKKFVSLAT